ncbi:MAG: phenylalanine--tRNA ligase subunit beta [Clostridiales bacterium]|nr:phenylalanine--tRNA ligase subunit beta [Clostridiales bacterium]
MNLSYKWLKDFVDIDDIGPREFAEAMTMSGSKVECWSYEGEKLSNVVVCKILSMDKHPDADKLKVCMVDIGEAEPIQIVTAATNVKPGDLVPVAKDKSTLADGTKITKGKLRGVLSLGMFCGLEEIGVTKHDFPYADEEGVLVIQEDCKPGDDIREALGLNDLTVEFEITSNRPDCFSVIGLAREAAATFDKSLKLHTPVVKGGFGDCTNMLDVKIENPELCKIYAARIVKNVRVKSSPRWMRERLRAMGVRPINNIVDITNYVMLEYGQPMHAFDLRFIKDGKIRIRNAAKGEKITTLDGIERTLKSSNLVIADAEKPVAIAGVMGGEYSGIVDDTTTIVFESANFLGSSVRITAKEQGMRTDASSRFEKGLDVNSCIPALERACELVEMLDAGDVTDGIIVDDKSDARVTKISFEPEKINKFLSTNLSEQDMIKILEKIECKVEGYEITVPSFRPDLIHFADIAEEIARFYGYNNIPDTAVAGGAQGKYSPEQKFKNRIIDTMTALGCNEIMTYSFISPKQYSKLTMPESHRLRKSLVISNPLGEDTSIMRTTALPSMLDILSKNYNNRNKEAYLFEIAKEYIPNGENELPNELNKLICGMYGAQADYFTIKGIMEELLSNIGINNYDIERAESEYAYHPGRSAYIVINGEKAGIIGEIHPTVCKNFEIGERVYCLELDIDMLFKLAVSEHKYTPLPRFPAVSRDIAIICDENIPVLTLERAIQKATGKLLEKVTLFDVYQGKQVESGKKSVAFNITLRSAESTLTDEQIKTVMDKSVKALADLGAQLRA